MSTGPLGKTLRMFLVDGTPGGIVVAEIINWSGQVTRFPRELLAKFLERQESNRTGVYLLIGNDDEVPGRLRVYVGETDNVGNRIRQHANDEEKSYWDFACAITSKDQNLTKAHVLYLESQIITSAIFADRVTIDNSQMKPYENMPESDISDMAYFFGQISTVLPALGMELFAPSEFQQSESAAAQEADFPSFNPANFHRVDVTSRRSSIDPLTGPSPIEVALRDAKFGIEARGLESNGEILVRTGSQARGINESETNVYRQLRARLIREGKIRETSDPRILEFASDVLFNSPSAASAVILDRNDNGRTSWRELKTGKSLNAWYAEHANSTQQASTSEGAPASTIEAPTVQAIP